MVVIEAFTLKAPLPIPRCCRQVCVTIRALVPTPRALVDHRGEVS